jgi:hypothetical protein
MTDKFLRIALLALPIIIMIGLIPVIADDVFLTLVYISIAAFTFAFKRKPYDHLAYIFGLVGITISEYLFIQTGVEVFVRKSFLGIMPLWLPFLWAYAFVVIKRSLIILDR